MMKLELSNVTIEFGQDIRWFPSVNFKRFGVYVEIPANKPEELELLASALMAYAEAIRKAKRD